MSDLEIEVMMEDNHLFVMDIDSILEAPQPGASMICRKCGKPGKIARVGAPGRKNREPRPTDNRQTSIFKE
jgi:hypothetical protein